MSAKINYIDLNENDCIFLRLKGSVEVSLTVRVEKGELLAHGPFNMLGRTFRIEEKGMFEVTQEVK